MSMKTFKTSSVPLPRPRLSVTSHYNRATPYLVRARRAARKLTLAELEASLVYLAEQAGVREHAEAAASLAQVISNEIRQRASSRSETC